MDPIQRLARRIRSVEKLAFRAATQPQLAYSSIEDGAIQSVEDGSLKAIIGKQWDGTQAIAIVNGPPPPQPSEPTATAALEGAVISWDGLFADGSVAPMDFARVEAHVSTDPDFTAEFAETLKATFETPRGGSVFVSLVPATYYVKLVARNSSGGRSLVSMAATVIPQAVSDSLPPASDGEAPTSSPLPVVQGGVKSLFIGWDLIDNADPVTYEVHISETSGFTPDSTTLSGETTGQLHVIRTMPGETDRLDYATPYYIRIVAKDMDGAAPPSAQVSAQPVQIDTMDISDGSITTVKIPDDAITAGQIANEAVTTAKVATDAITSDLIAANAVTSTEIADGSISTPKLVAGAVTAAKIAAETITANEIAANAVTTAKLAAGAVTAAKIAAETITADEIASNTISADQLAANAVTADKILAESISADKIAANAVTADKIAANAVTADKIFANSITADKLSTLLVLASRIEVGSAISIDPATGITINLTNGGYIKLPANGNPAELKGVILQATALVVDNNLTVNGATNQINGILALNANVPPPTVAPTLASLSDQAPITASPSLGGIQQGGLGDNGTQWELGGHWNFDSDYARSSIGVYTVDKTTGARSVKWNKTVDLWGADLAAAGISVPLNDGWQIISTSPPVPVLTSFHSNSQYAVFAFYRPAWSGTRGFNVRGDVPTSFSFPAQYRIVVVDNITPTNTPLNWVWAPASDWAKPAVFYDGTKLNVAASRVSDLKVIAFSYNLDGTGGAVTMSTVGQHYTDWTGLYVGSADFASSSGNTKRWVLTFGGQAVYVFDIGGNYMTNEVWTPSNGEVATGVAWSGTRFYSYHIASSKIRKYSTIPLDVSRSVKHTWYNSTTGSESTASPVGVFTQARRQWLQAIAPSIPTGLSSAYPNSVRFYVAAHRQADPGVGVLSAIYEVPSTTNGDAPSTDAFAVLGNAGVIQSNKTDSTGAPAWKLSGDGTIRMFTGEIRAFAGITAPAGTLLCDGASYLRTTYPSLFAAISFVTTGTGASGQAVVTVSSTSNIGVGMKVEAPGIPAGATVASVNSATTFTLSANITTTLTGSNNVTVIPHGAADSTHFYVPNYGGKVVVGRDSTQTEFAKLGQTGGEKAHTLTTAELPGGAVIRGGVSYYFNQGTTTPDRASDGGGQAHNNLQPYIVANYIIAT